MCTDRLDIKLGYQCNNNCIFCAIGDCRGDFPEFEFDTIKSMICNAREDGIKELTLTGGEPTLRKDIIDIISEASHAGFEKILIITNGRMLSYKHFTEKLVTVGVNKFMISIHANESGLNDIITRAPGSFNQTMKGIENIVNYDLEIIIGFTINSFNYKIIPEFVYYLKNRFDIESKKNFVLQFTFIIPDGLGKIEYRKLCPSYTQAIPYLKNAIEDSKLKRNRIKLMNIPFCVVPGYENLLNELTIKNIKIVGSNPAHSEDDYNAHRKDVKTKTEDCKTCKFDKYCDGFWPLYKELYGVKEFVPVNK